MTDMQITYQDRVRGMLIGAALGDALGLPIEDKPSEVVQIYLDHLRIDPVAAQTAFHAVWIHLKSQGGPVTTPKLPMQISDDTLCLEAICRTVVTCHGNFDSLVYGRTYAGLMWKKGFGGTSTKAALARIREGVSISLSANGGRVDDPLPVPGNGAAMAAVADGVLGYRLKLETLRRRVRKRAMVTHRHPQAILAAELLAVAGWWLVQPENAGRHPWEMIRLVKKEFLELAGHPVRYQGVLASCYQAAGLTADEGCTLPQHGLVCALWALNCLWNNRGDLACDLGMAFKPGGDTDTVGCMFGALYGAYYGYEHLKAEALVQTTAPLLHYGGDPYNERLLQLADRVAAF